MKLTVAALALFSIVLLADTPKHEHPAQLPVDESIFLHCCHENDCQEANVRVRYLNKSTAFVAVNGWEPFTMPTAKIFPSQNGLSYHCRIDISKPPSTDNIRCVFIAAGNYASR